MIWYCPEFIYYSVLFTYKVCGVVVSAVCVCYCRLRVDESDASHSSAPVMTQWVLGHPRIHPSSALFALGFASSPVKCCFVIEVFAQGCPITALSRWSAWWTHNLFMKRQGVNPNSRSQTFSPGRWELSGLGSTHQAHMSSALHLLFCHCHTKYIYGALNLSDTRVSPFICPWV